MERKLIVITGGPGVGKTTLLAALKKEGLIVVPEEARRIIQEQIEVGTDALPWKNKERYAQLMFEASVETYKNVVKEFSLQPAFFDRGILDTICYMKMEKIPISVEMDSQAKSLTYAQQVFILPPWREIYKKDNERKQTWEEAVYTFEKMKQTYLEYGYDVIEVPTATVEYRCEFILNCIK
ncbi:AAA family ATPase [Flavobacterium sp. HSC-61S13]|uniref:AAA family ATPase n=1 Tax=Flavobacterium sp. HSC-61S13 TaxID=2910963 RepID=UPI00209F52F2|nr:AAA family ATPase [Flavobacterium sp. HSC-61S13]MCP1997342.1 putative ATPase [Flavobacterium sp. HSC-61S13]